MAQNPPQVPYNAPMTTQNGTPTQVWAAWFRQLLGLASQSQPTYPITIPNGGTGQTTANAALNALLPAQAGNAGKSLTTDGTNSSWTTPASSSGTVTSVSVVSANGLAGSVATATTTPAITLSTSVTGVLKGNGSAISAATSGTDYAPGTASLGTGILKSTTGTGALNVAVASDFPTLNQNTTGTASNVTGTVAIANGGTGQTTANAALNALLPSQTGNAGKFLKTDGSNTSFGTLTPTYIAPTVQRFTSGSGTYTTPAGVLYIKVTLAGGGGGGGGAGTSGGTNGSAGGSSTFGTILTAGGGSGGAGAGAGVFGGTGGSATVSSPAVTLKALSGGSGSGVLNATGYVPGGLGGCNPLGGAGAVTGGASNGGAGVTNTGAGGGGGAGSGGIGSTGTATAAAGGGAGAYIEAIISSPSATYAYAVGASGGGGVGGTNTGGAGGSGVVIVEEFYQ